MGLDRATRRSVLGLIKRHEVQVLRRAGHSQTEVSRLTGVSLSEIRRIEAEEPVENYDDAAERRRRGIGRPSKAEPLRAFVVEQLARDPRQTSLDLLQRRQGRRLPGKQERVLRPRGEAAPGGDAGRSRPSVTSRADVSQHGFGDVDVHFGGAGPQRVHFFVSQLAYSRWCAVTLTPDRQMESLLRALVEHFARIGGVPLVAVLDRHNAGAIVTNVEGVGGRGIPPSRRPSSTSGSASTSAGAGATSARAPRWRGSSGGSRPRSSRRANSPTLATSRRGSGSGDDEANTRATVARDGVVPEARMAEERVRLRPLGVRSEDFALRIPVTVGPGSRGRLRGHRLSDAGRDRGQAGHAVSPFSTSPHRG